MTQPPNPVMQGFRAARRNPAIVLLEVLWRWSFAIVAVFLLFAAGAILLGPLHVGDSFLSAWRTQNISKIGIIVLSVVLTLGAKLLIVLVVLPVVVGLIWSLLAAAARRITIRRLGFNKRPLGFGPMLAVQWLRALITVIAFFLLIAGVF